MNIVETEIRVFAHSMQIAVNDKGEIKFAIDGGQTKNAKKFEDGKIIFIGIEELVVKGELQEFKFIQLPKEDYEKLASAREAILNDIAAEKSSALLKRENKSDILKRVDRWKKRIKKYRKDKNDKTKIPYAIHDFTIGAQTYKFFERKLESEYSDDGILINPAYSVQRGFPEGAVPVKKGELTFWIYHTEETGWQTVRELTLNELTCIEIIRRHGMVASGKI